MDEEKVYCSMYSRNAELYHHGIKGQKWGVRNGPPYPLGSGKGSSRSAKEKIESRDEKLRRINEFLNKKEKFYFYDYYNTDSFKKNKKEIESIHTKEEKIKINKLESEISKLEKDLDKLDYKIELLDEKFGYPDDNKEIENLRKEYNELEKTITNKMNELINAQGKKYLDLLTKNGNEHREYIFLKMENDLEVKNARKELDEAINAFKDSKNVK